MMDSSHRSHTLSETAEEVLTRRAESLSLQEIDEETSDHVSLLLFRIGDEGYAVGVAAVREIFQEYEVTSIPCVPDFILGVVNVRGEILSVTDPARIMHIGSIEEMDGVKPPAIVMANDEVATAVVVDEIGDITDVPHGSIEPPVSIIDRAQAEFIEGSVFVGGAMVGLLKVARILEPIGATSKI